MAFSNKFDDANSLVRCGRNGMTLNSAERAPLRGLLLLAALAAAVFLAALLIGSSGIGVSRSLAALLGSGDETTRSVLIAVRLPRVLAAFGVGALSGRRDLRRSWRLFNGPERSNGPQ